MPAGCPKCNRLLGVPLYACPGKRCPFCGYNQREAEVKVEWQENHYASQARVQRQKCPYCGKKKFKLAKHIRVRHPDKPSIAKVVTQKELPTPPALEKDQSSAPAFVKVDSKPKVVCLHCEKTLTRITQHITGTHKLRPIKCPFCGETFGVNSSGQSRCLSCERTFTLKRNYGLKGSFIKCPACLDEFYVEKAGKVRCQWCYQPLQLNKDLTLRPFSQPME